jgi:transcription antitermination factor NusB
MTVQQLAEAIDTPVDEVRAVLGARDEPNAPDDAVGPELSVAVAGVLGQKVMVEPRDLALETLYELEVRGESELDGLPPRARALVDGVTGGREQLDHLIESASEHWSVARMPMIDRSILRLGLYELTAEDTPIAVVVSEAVRLAKTYSTERSGAFVNGVLATLAREERR